MIIFYNFRRELTQQQCIDELNLIFGDEAQSRTSVYRWYGEFNRSRSSLQDEFRDSRSKSAVVPETIDAVRQLILQDRHMTYREIETTKKICSRLILHNLTITQKNQSIRVAKVLRQLVQTHAKVYR